jgi:hypothetical protein
MSSIPARIERLEKAVDLQAASAPQIIVYQPGQQPEPAPPDGRVRIYLPDNGRGPSGATQCP